jgi:3-hydroxybutyryl-CoA dehydrogenase
LSPTTIKHVLVVGAGTMGQQIGLQCAMHGFDVTLYDVDPDALQTALLAVDAYAAGLREAGQLSAEQAEAALARITAATDPAQAAAGADLVSESVPEDPQLKGKVFAQFNALCPPHTIFTTNTSSLVPSMIAEATGRPGQFAALHFHQPVWTANLVDVMPHPGTSAETLAQVEAFARQIGQIPIVLNKENYGYVFNAMYNALNREAITLAANGVASVEDIDRAWMVVMKAPAGPMGMLDIVGLETAWHITDYWANLLDDPQLKKNAAFLKEYVDKGWLGVKTGRGFYSYPDPAFAQPGFLEGES